VLHLRPGLTIPPDEVEVRVSRSSGPGGQHANVTASRVEASFDVAASSVLSDGQKRRIMGRCGPVVRAVSQDTRSQHRNRELEDTRSQHRNRELALERLGARIANALAVQRPRKKTKPTRASKERRLQQKRRHGETKRLRGRPEF
jgi:ribosome-associated protein